MNTLKMPALCGLSGQNNLYYFSLVLKALEYNDLIFTLYLHFSKSVQFKQKKIKAIINQEKNNG